MKLTNRHVTLLGNAMGFAGFPVTSTRSRLTFYDVAVYREDVNELTEAGLLENPSQLVYYTSDAGKAAYQEAIKGL